MHACLQETVVWALSTNTKKTRHTFSQVSDYVCTGKALSQTLLQVSMYMYVCGFCRPLWFKRTGK